MRDFRIDKVVVGERYNMTNKNKVNGINENQRNTVTEGDVCYRTEEVKVTNFEEREDKYGRYIYFGFVPSGKSVGFCGFGYEKMYIDGNPFQYVLVGFESIYNKPALVAGSC